jgi:hypothetical protein
MTALAWALRKAQPSTDGAAVPRRRRRDWAADLHRGGARGHRRRSPDRAIGAWPLFILFVLLSASSSLAIAEKAPRAPVADILGTTVYDDDLVARKADDEQKAKLSPADYQAWHQRTREEALRRRVWSAVFADYAQKRRVEPTPAEIESQVRAQKKFMAEDKVRREKQREELIAELKAPGLSDSRRVQAQQHLDTLNSLRDHDARRQSERSDPAAERVRQESERKVAAMWVKQWKVNQALYREYGGRIVFQQAGWEPIDAYRLLLDEYKREKRFVVHDPRMQDAVYGYFRHRFVYADEQKAKFYFEKPYWERTQEEMRAAGF